MLSNPSTWSRFLSLWFGQLPAQLCTATSEFAAGIWVFQARGSALDYAATLACAIVPVVAVAPWAGVAVDRWGGRRVMLAADTLALGVCIAMMFAWAGGALSVVAVCVANALSAAARGTHRSAYQCQARMLIPEHSLGRGNGLMRIGSSLAQLAAPTLAGALMASANLGAALGLEAASLALALGVLTLQASVRGTQTNPPNSVGAANMEALRWLWQEPRLRTVMVFGLLENSMLGLGMGLALPMLLSRHTPTQAGLALSLAGVGSLLGALVMLAWGGPRCLVRGILQLDAGFGFAFVLLAAIPQWLVACATLLAASVCGALIEAYQQTLLQQRVPEVLQGRVQALTAGLSLATFPIAALVAGLLADRWLEPALQPGGVWAQALAPWWPSGSGQGIALLVVLAGALLTGLSLVGNLWLRESRLSPAITG